MIAAKVKKVEFTPGDFVVLNYVPDKVGVVCVGKKLVQKEDQKYNKFMEEEVEVWFGELAESGLALTHYVPIKNLINLGCFARERKLI